MKILVTGGSGFIGTNFIHYLLREYQNIHVINLDKLTYAANEAANEDLSPNQYTFVWGDICDENIVDELVSQVDVIINFAAESHVDNSIQNAFPFIQTNILGTMTLLEAAKKHNIGLFLQISTDEVYGSGGPFTEQSPLNPSSAYSSSKASADLLCLAYHKTFNLPVIITRSSNNYGPHQHQEKFIPTILTNILSNKKIPVYGTGENIRNWIYVEDNCAAIDKVRLHGVPGHCYNISTYDFITNIDLVYMILGLMGLSDDQILFVKDRLGHDERYDVLSEQVRRLGWSPQISFEKGIQKTIEWYLN